MYSLYEYVNVMYYLLRLCVIYSQIYGTFSIEVLKKPKQCNQDAKHGASELCMDSNIDGFLQTNFLK